MNQRLRSTCRLKQYPAFTLVELLVVIVIVGALSALLFPAAISAKRSADNTKSIANLRQVHGLMMSYASDNDGWMCASQDDGAPRMPPGSSRFWWESLMNYVGPDSSKAADMNNRRDLARAFYNPGASASNTTSFAAWLVAPGTYRFNISMAQVYVPSVNLNGHADSQMLLHNPRLSQRALFHDRINGLHSTRSPAITSSLAGTPEQVRTHYFRNGGIAIVFLDGSARIVPSSEINPNWWSRDLQE